MKDLILLAKGNSRSHCPFDGAEVWGVNDVGNFPEFKGKHIDRVFTFDPRSPDWLKDARVAPIWSWQSYADKQYPLQEVIKHFNTKYFTNTISYMLALAIYEEFERIRLYGVDAPYGGIYFMEKSGLEYWIGRAQQKGIEVVPCEESLMLQTYDGLLYGERGSTSIDMYLSDRNYLMNILPKEGDFDTMYLANLARWLLAVKVTERDQHTIQVGADNKGNVVYQSKQEFLSRIHFPSWVLTWLRNILRSIEAQGKLPISMVSIYGVLCKLNQPEPISEHKKGSRVSFILSTKNRANILTKCLDNVKQLIKPEDEFIIVDGKSTDNTLQVLEQYKSIITKVISREDVNSAHAMNRGILEAKGKYVKQICDDDLVNPQEFELSIKYMEDHPDVDLLVCGGIKHTATGKYQVDAPKTYGQKVEDVFQYGACGTGFVYRRDSFAKYGMINTDFINVDREIICRYISKGAVVRFLPGQHYLHAPYAHSASIVNLERWKAEDKLLKEKYCPELVTNANQ